MSFFDISSLRGVKKMRFPVLKLLEIENIHLRGVTLSTKNCFKIGVNISVCLLLCWTYKKKKKESEILGLFVEQVD